MTPGPETNLTDIADDDVMLAFSGCFDQKILVALNESLAARLNQAGVPTDKTHLVQEILIEQAQNVLQHSGASGQNAGVRRGFCIVKRTGENRFEISTGNIVPEPKLRRLVESVEELNGMTPEQLTGLFQNTGKNGRLRPNRTSGLGLIQMARKSAAPLRVQTRPADVARAMHYFILTVQV